MNRIAFVLVIILCNVMYANADTYTWTDDAGVVSFTEDSTRIPSKYRSKATKEEDITTRNPKVQQELKEQEDKARKDEINRPRIVPPPDNVPPPKQLPAVEPTKPASDILPPGRPKSQRIRENVERREAEEKAKQLDEKKY